MRRKHVLDACPTHVGIAAIIEGAQFCPLVYHVAHVLHALERGIEFFFSGREGARDLYQQTEQPGASCAEQAKRMPGHFGRHRLYLSRAESVARDAQKAGGGRVERHIRREGGRIGHYNCLFHFYSSPIGCVSGA